MRRQVLSAAAPACLLLGLTPLSAGAEVAPPGHATATAAKVSSLAEISSTGADAKPDKADAKAAVVSIGGQPALGTGGSQSNEGESGGSVLDTGDRAGARAQVAPWKASAKGSKTSARRSSHASAAAARAEVPSEAKVGVLTSDSQADHQADQSKAMSSSEAADIALGDTPRLVLLHSEVGSSGKGHSYLVGLNGTEIGTDEQLGKGCALDAAGVASLTCLTASGGVANGLTTGAAEVLGVKTALGLDPTAAFSTAASYGQGSVTPPPSILPGVGEAVTADTPRAAALAPAATPTAAGLPRTGVAAASTAASALAALLSGLVLRLIGRRRSAA
jgi:hypothetical protein